MSKKAIFCLAESQTHAEKIVYRLKNSGFLNRDVSALYPEMDAAAAEQAEAAAAKNAASGGLTWLPELGKVAIDGFGPFVGAGPIVRALKRADGGAKGRIVRSLTGMGVPESEAKAFDKKINRGNVLISFHNEHAGEITRAEAILKLAGGQDLCATDESAGDVANNPGSAETLRIVAGA